MEGFEIEKGVWRYDREIKTPKEKPLVLVHPWYNRETNKFKLYSGKGDYLSNLTHLLKESRNREVILFEEEVHEPRSAKEIKKLRGDKGLYWIAMDLIQHSPFWDITKLIKEKSLDADIAGGHVWDTTDKSDRGCAGLVYEELKEREVAVDFVSGCCFTFSDRRGYRYRRRKATSNPKPQ